MNSYPNLGVDLRDVLNERLNSDRDRPYEPVGFFATAENNHIFPTANDFHTAKPTHSPNEPSNPSTGFRPFIQHAITPLPNQSSTNVRPLFNSILNSNFSLNQNLNSNLNFTSTFNSNQQSNSILNFFANSIQTSSTIRDSSDGIRPATFTPFVAQAPSTDRPVQSGLFGQNTQSMISSLTQPPATMTSSTSINSTAKTPGRRKNNQSKFQELPLFFTDLEILHSFTVYVTNHASIILTLKKAQVEAIRYSQKSIFIRFCKFDQHRDLQKENLPKNVRLTINSCLVPLEIKNSSPNLKSPIDVTNRCRIVTTRMANTFEFHLDTMLDNCKKIIRGNGYGIEIVLAKKLTVSDTLAALTTSETHTRSYEQTLRLIKERCAGFDEIECEALKVPLTCVVTKKTIQLPLVGLKCRHVACFDGATFLEMHQNKQEYVCVICHTLIRRNELVRDPWIERILLATSREVEQIEFDSSGKYKVSQPEKCAPRQRLKRIECITLDDEEEMRTSSPAALKMTIKRPKIELFGALDLASTAGDQANSSQGQNEASIDRPNRTFSSGTSADAPNGFRAPTINSPNNAIHLDSDSDQSVIVLNSDTEPSDNDSNAASDGSLRYSIQANRVRALFSSSEDTEISDNEDTMNDSENFDEEADSNGEDAGLEGFNSENADSDDSDEDFLTTRRRPRRSGLFSSSNEESISDFSNESDDESDQSLSDLSSNSNLSSLSNSSDASGGSKAQEPSSSSTFTPLLSRGSLNKRRRRARRFD